MRAFLLFLSTMVFCANTNAQVSLGRTTEEGFQFMVKQYDEFIHRFNFETGPQGERIVDTAYAYIRNPNGDIKINRRQALEFLIDHNLFNSVDSLICREFVRQVVTTKPQTISFWDKGFYASINMDMTVNGKAESGRFTLEVDNKGPIEGSKWVICGLEASAILPRQTTKNRDKLIPPSNNESQFLGLVSAFEDRKHFETYLPNTFQSDPLSILHQRVTEEGSIKCIGPDGLPEYHLTQIAGWIVIVSRIDREYWNRGWLITNLVKIQEDQKEIYLEHVLNIPKYLH